MRGLRYQPQGGAKLSALAKSLGFTHAFNFGDGVAPAINRVTNTQAISPASGASIVGGPGGRAVRFAGSNTNRLEIAGNPFATAVCTYLWVESGVDTSSSGQSLTNSKYNSDPASETGSLQIRLSGSSITVLQAQVAVQLAASGARDNTGKVNVCALTVAGDNGRHALFVGGRLAAAAAPTTSYNHGVSVIGGGSDCPSSTIHTYGLLFAPKVLPDDVLKFLTANPWLLFAAPYEDEVVAVNTSLGPGTAPLTITGFAPSVARGVTTDIAPGSSGLTIAGYAPSVTQGLTKTISPAPASLTVTGYAPAVSQTAARSLDPASASLTITGYAPTVSRGASQTIPAGAAVPSTLQLRGYAPTITQANNVTPHMYDATIMRLSAVRNVVELGPDRIQQTADLL